MHSIALTDYQTSLMKKIDSRMPIIKKSMTAFGKKNSQTSSSLMTLNMIDSGPYRVLRQIMAQIQNKREALRSAAYKHNKNSIRINEIGSLLETEKNAFKLQRLELEREKKLSDMEESRLYIDAAIKELGAFQERYFEVLRNNGIAEDWKEKDFEAAEIAHHIKSIFRNAIRDRLAGARNHGTMEYMEQYGIEPIVGYELVDNFIIGIKSHIGESKAPTIAMRYEFYEKVVELFKDEYKRALSYIGLNSATYDEWMIRHD